MPLVIGITSVHRLLYVVIMHQAVATEKFVWCVRGQQGQLSISITNEARFVQRAEAIDHSPGIVRHVLHLDSELGWMAAIAVSAAEAGSSGSGKEQLWIMIRRVRRLVSASSSSSGVSFYPRVVVTRVTTV